MATPHIDYLAKDFASWKRLLRDRLTALIPAALDENPADLGTVIIEALSYAADQISYYQDAVATEAYLGTARQRISVRRHARLLDYFLHEGQNARALCAFEIKKDSAADGALLPRGTMLLTRRPGQPTAIAAASAEFLAGAQVFETMHDQVLSAARNSIAFYNPYQQVLPIGATSCKLESPATPLLPGDVLIFIEVCDPETLLPEDADPTHRHAVRLKSVKTSLPSRTSRHKIVELEWAVEDALPFPLDMSCAAALGNVVLCDHGQTLAAPEPLTLSSRSTRLRAGPLTFVAQTRDAAGRRVPFSPSAPIAAAFSTSPRDASPAIVLRDAEDSEMRWTPQPDLLSSDRFAHHFVVETDNRGRAVLRFGDGVLGRRPDPERALVARYRIGNGPAGNVGAESLSHVVTPLTGIISVRNPLPAQGGLQPEALDEARLHAPAAFRAQERALRSEDYAALAMRHPQVHQALATGRFTGSIYTIILAVQRKGGMNVDAAFVSALRDFIEPYRRIGHDVTVVAPVLVPLDIRISVSVAEDYVRSAVQSALTEVFSSREPSGFFHPDHYSFGEPVYFSRIVHRAMQVPGVRFVHTDPQVTRFARYGHLDELQSGAIAMRGLELPRIDNDEAAPQNGRIRFTLRGGL